jgi:hypothetical protein
MVRALIIVGAFVIGLPIVLSLGMMMFGMAGSFWLSSMFMTTIGAEEPPQKAEWNVVNLSDGKSFADFTHAREAYRTIVEPKRVMALRSVRFNTLIAPEDVPGAFGGGSSPQNAVRLYAPTLAAEECARLKLILADQCVVEKTDVNDQNDRLFDIEIRLNFTMKADFGTVPENVPLMIATVDQSLTEGAKIGKLIARTEQIEVRRALYRRTVETCNRIRSNKGNCAVVSIELKTKLERQSETALRLNGKANIAFLQKH